MVFRPTRPVLSTASVIFRSPLLALGALVLFGLGSVGAPLLHRAAHAAEHLETHAAHEQLDAHVHGDGVGATGALPEWLDLDEACALCQIQLTTVALAPTYLGGLGEYDDAPALSPAAAPPVQVDRQYARGPPA